MEVLEESNTPLRFSGLKVKVEEKLHRYVHPEAIAAANKSLLKIGSIDKKLKGGTIVYELSSQFYKQATKNLLLGLIESLRLNELSANFDVSEGTVPSIISISPTPKDTYETADESELKLGVDVNWESPSNGISSIICNDFLMLSGITRNGITNLMLWAYWVGTQSLKNTQKISDVEMPAMESNLKRCLEFSTGILDKARKKKDVERVKTEEAIIKILNITLELLKKDNLYEFLSYANEKRGEVMKAENIILAVEGHFMASGERIFHDIVRTKRDMVMKGLSLIGNKTKKMHAVKFSFERRLPRDEAVWNYFIDFLIELCPDSSLKEVRGTYEETIAKAKTYLSYLNDLTNVIAKRQIIAIYLWNIPVARARSCIRP